MYGSWLVVPSARKFRPQQRIDLERVRNRFEKKDVALLENFVSSLNFDFK